MSDSRADGPARHSFTGRETEAQEKLTPGQVFPEEVGFHPQAGEEERLWVQETWGWGELEGGPCLVYTGVSTDPALGPSGFSSPTGTPDLGHPA